MEKFQVPQKLNSLLLGFIGIGIISLIIGFWLDAPRAWAGLLVLTFFIITISLSGSFFTAFQFVSGASWSVVIRRVTETMVSALPIGGIGVLILIIGLLTHSHHLYHWADPKVVVQDHILQQKAGYLNTPFFIIRLIIYFLALYFMGTVLKKVSLKQDEKKDPKMRATLVRLSAGYLLIFAYFFSLMSIDLIMSLEPHWYTTMFPIYTFSGLAYSGFAAIIILIVTIQKHGGLKEVNKEHFQDLGKFQFGFTLFWAYITFSQFMLIWYANLPEETIYLENRLPGEWKFFTGIFWFLHFAVPFFILLSRDIKRNPSKLIKVAWGILFMGFVDVIWIVYGALDKENVIKGFPISWMEIGIFLGAIGLVGYSVLRAYSKVNPIPVEDPYLEESLKFHQSH